MLYAQAFQRHHPEMLLNVAARQFLEGSRIAPVQSVFADYLRR
jgi:hypothetical protein